MVRKIISDKPFFSIITCTYNSERFVERNINSIIDQTFNSYEHVFIDGMSSDKTGDIIKKYRKKSLANVRLYTYAPKGISNAMNNGIKKSKGKYIIHLHADDSLVDKQILSNIYKFLNENKKLDWIYGMMMVIEENGKEVGIWPKQRIFHKPHPYILKYYDYIPHQSVFIKREVFDKFGYFDESINSIMDTDFWLRIANDTKWNFCNMVISNYMISSVSQTASKSNVKLNNKNLYIVRSRYLNILEMLMFKIISTIINKFNNYSR